MNETNKDSVLYAWIGHTDIRSMQENQTENVGPIAQAVQHKNYDYVELISDLDTKIFKSYVAWLKPQSKAKLTHHASSLSSPVDFGEIYTAVTKVIYSVDKRLGDKANYTFHLSPGTPAMAAVWIILAKTRFAAELIESSRENGVNTANVPFDISAEFIPNLIKQADQRISDLNTDQYQADEAFESIVHQSIAMKNVLMKAQKVAPRTLPVLIEGESGTGKELLARSIHQASLRYEQSFVAVNCGAINKELADSEFFGHKKGAFTGAVAERKGYFEEANKGTLFLDEIGELPLELQVKLLRAIQEQEIIPVGASKPIKIDIRIISATNRSLIDEVKEGLFREDLFYRIAVAVLKLPALRDRKGDLNLLIDYLMKKINQESAAEPNWKHKNISFSARNIMLSHVWTGNFRELSNTLLRASLWSDNKTIEAEDIEDAMLYSTKDKIDNTGLLNRNISQGIDLQSILDEVSQHYLVKALDEANGNKRKATELLGLGNYQTLSNWLKKYDLE